MLLRYHESYFSLTKMNHVFLQYKYFLCQIDYNQFEFTTIVLLHIAWLDYG